MKLKVIVYFTFIQFLLAASTVSGQKILYPLLNPADARFDNLEVDKGRGGATVYSLLQDNRGFIWCGTDGGLYRYDGTRFIRFWYGDSDTTICGNIALSMLEDSSGALWVGTHGGLNLIHSDKRKISHFIPDTANLKSYDNSIRLIRKDKKGNIWILTDWNVFRINPEEGIFRKFPTDTLPLRLSYVPIAEEKDKYIEDINGNIWIASSKGLFNYSYKSDKWKKVFPMAKSEGIINNQVNCIKADNYGRLWFGTESDGLFMIPDPEAGTYENVARVIRRKAGNPVAPITSLIIKNQNDLWFTTDTTLCRINIQYRKPDEFIFSDAGGHPREWKLSSRFTRMINGQGDEIWLLNYAAGLIFRFNTATEKLSSHTVPRYIVFDALLDSSGNLWSGCIANNIFILVTSGLPYLTRNIANISGVKLSNAQLLGEDRQGNIIVLTHNSVIKLSNSGNSLELTPEESDLNYKNHSPKCIFRDNRLNIWLAFSNGVIRKHDPEGRLIKNYILQDVHMNNPKESVILIRNDNQGNLWFITEDGDIYTLNPEVNEIRIKIKANEFANVGEKIEVLDFNIDIENKLWISTIEDIYRIDPVNRIYERLSGFENTGKIYQFYCRIYKDHNQRLWILTSLGSPFYYNHQQNKLISPFRNELVPDLGFYDIQVDRKGKMWLVDNNLITVFDTVSKTSVSYPWIMNGNSVRSYISDIGNIYFITHNQVIAFRQEKSINQFVPPIYLTRLLINNTDYFHTLNRWPNQEIPSKVMLSYKKNYLKIEFASLNYLNPDLNKYRYFMKGLDKDTTVSSGVPYAEYRGMPPGEYTFWVTGSNNDGIWNQIGVSLDIRIYPPWYKSVFANISYLLIIVSLIIIYIRFRIYKLTRDKERLEHEVKLRTEELEIKNNQLAEIDRIKTRFFTDISHEIRTPLTLIMGPIDILSKSFEGKGRISGMLNTMKRNADRLMQLVNELLDIVKLDAGKMKIILTEDDIIKNLRMLVYEFLSLAESRQINYIVEIPEAPYITWFDSYKLNIIITNLLSNAFRYTPNEGTVRCMIKIENNDLPYYTKYIKIIVSDTGRGISKEHIDRIFERFYRVEGHHETNGHGTGIGLSMVKEFINLLHGEIEVDSTPGKGSDFIVKIPLGKDHLSGSEYITADKNQSVPSRPPAITRTELQLENLIVPRHGELAKILIIEDNADLRNFIIENLSDSFHLLEAENGKTGSGLAYSMMPDLIISDIMMPDLDGIQLCNKLKNDVRTSHIPIILLTAKATTDDKLTGLKSGADDYIVKPFNMDELRTRVSNLLSIREKLKQKYLDSGSLEKIREDNKSVDDRFMEKVISLINDNLSNFDFDVALLHYSIGMSRMHLSRKLKALTGLSPHLLINRIRMEKAAELFRLNKGNVTEVANSVGFSNPANFSRAFREQFGISPKIYLNQFRNADKNPL